MVLEYTHTNNITHAEKVIVRSVYVYICTYIHAIKFSEKGGHEFEGSGESYMEGLEGGKGKDKFYN